MWKNVHPVYSAGIRTHDLWDVSLFPLPLDQDSRPQFCVFCEMNGRDELSRYNPFINKIIGIFSPLSLSLFLNGYSYR